MASKRQVPELSLKAFTHGSPKEKGEFIDGLFTGIKDYGFIILKDHPVRQELFDKAYSMLEKFFALPEETKKKYYDPQGGGRTGYTPFGKEHAKDAPVMDLKEFWHVAQSVPRTHKLVKYYPDNVWPTELPEFQSTMTEIYRGLEHSGQIMLRALTQPLGLSETYFDEMTQDGNSVLRLLHYPPIPEGVDPRCLRAAPHGDINLITILPAATAAGLQLKDRDGQWLDVDADPGTLIVDAGDMLSRITNELIPSTIHQVVNVSVGKSRYSMPFFMHPHPEAMLSCIPSCKGEKALYHDITAHDFLMQRLREIGLIK